MPFCHEEKQNVVCMIFCEHLIYFSLFYYKNCAECIQVRIRCDIIGQTNSCHRFPEININVFSIIIFHQLVAYILDCIGHHVSGFVGFNYTLKINLCLCIFFRQNGVISRSRVILTCSVTNIEGDCSFTY